VRQFDPQRAARLAMDENGADRSTGTDGGDYAFRRIRTVRTDRRRAEARSGEDQPVEVKAGLDAQLDIAVRAVDRHLRRRRIAETALGICRRGQRDNG